MALVSGPTVGGAISNPDNAVAKLAAEVADSADLVNQLFLRFLNRPGKPDEIAGASQMFAQVDADHALLVAELDAYSQEVAPQIAKRELERQGRVAALQAELEAHREIVRLRRPREERERQERIAKAQAALAEYDKQLAEKLPEWEAGQKTALPWYALDPVELGASYRARLVPQADGSIFVAGRNAKGTYRVAAPIALDRVTGIRLEALVDDRLPLRGPGRAGSGNFVVTEFDARWLPVAGARKLVRSWDFSSPADDWQSEDHAKVVADSGTRFLFGNRRRGGIKTSLNVPAGDYLLEVVSGVRSGLTFTVQWSTVAQPAFDEARSARRTLLVDDGNRKVTPISIHTDAELSGLRIAVDNDQAVLPIDAVRLFAADGAGYADIKLHKAQATFSQAGYPIESAIDGNRTADNGNGWAVYPELGQDHSAVFELVTPLEAARNGVLELTIHQNYTDSQHSLGRFRISLTDAPSPLAFGLPPEIAASLAKPAEQRSDAERNALLELVRKSDEQYKKLQAELAREQQALPDDPRLKQLESELANAQEALPVDMKLQRLRRAVALSEEQLKNKRLTVAQDIVWALINSPAFLYNH
jgi:hypothetical protein